MLAVERCARIAALAVLAYPFALYSQQSPPATAHIRSARVESHEEATPGQCQLGSTEFVCTAYTVDYGNFTYVLESADKRQPEVGKDYEVEKIAHGEMVLLIPGKKRPAEVSFYIKAKSEKQ